MALKDVFFKMKVMFLNEQKTKYKSNFSAIDFKNKLEGIFNQGTFKFKYNLSGEFINAFEFKAHDKWTFGLFISSFENDPAYLKGNIIEKNNHIIIDIYTRPNSIFSILGFLLPTLGILSFLIIGFENINEDFLVNNFIFSLVGVLFYPLGTLFRNRLRNKFEKYLELKRF